MYNHSEADTACIDIGGITYDGEGLPESRSVYDTALLLMGLYHIIEWFRTILLLTVTCMKYEILMYIYNALFFNAIFGVIAAMYAHAARLGYNGT
jgi:ABC-type polysaccharide/polyol phosphate export permease